MHNIVAMHENERESSNHKIFWHVSKSFYSTAHIYIYQYGILNRAILTHSLVSFVTSFRANVCQKLFLASQKLAINFPKCDALVLWWIIAITSRVENNFFPSPQAKYFLALKLCLVGFEEFVLFAQRYTDHCKHKKGCLGPP